MQNQPLRLHQKALLLATLLAVVAWAVPAFSWVMLPLQYLNAHLHEMCHAIMAALTGGQIEYIKVFSNGSGVTPVAGGGVLLVGSAGYLGAALIGASMIYFGRSERSARFVLRTLAVALTASLVLWVRGDWVGVVSGIGWVVVLLGYSFMFRGLPLLFGVQFFGLQQCLTSLQAVYIVLRISALGERHSDAQLLAESTHLPALFWALLWCGISVSLMFVTLRAAWTHHAEGASAASTAIS